MGLPRMMENPKRNNSNPKAFTIFETPSILVKTIDVSEINGAIEEKKEGRTIYVNDQ